MKPTFLMLAKECFFLAFGLVTLRIYLFRQEPTYWLLSESIFSGVVWAFLVYKFVRFTKKKNDNMEP